MEHNGGGGTWNRAGRRRGGARPIDLTPPPRYVCASCQAENITALMEKRLVTVAGLSVEVALCIGCHGVLLHREDGSRSSWQRSAKED